MAYFTGRKDENMEDEFRKLELENENENCQRESGIKSPFLEHRASQSAASLSDALGNLRLLDGAGERVIDGSEPSMMI